MEADDGENRYSVENVVKSRKGKDFVRKDATCVEKYIVRGDSIDGERSKRDSKYALRSHIC